MDIIGFGFCPICGKPGKSRERRPNGDDRCEDGHAYPSSNALMEPPEKIVTEHKFSVGDKVLITADIIGLRYLNGTVATVDSVTAYGHYIIKQTLINEKYLTLVEDD